MVKFKALAKSFKKGFLQTRKKEWKCCQLQSNLHYRGKNVKAKEFRTPQEAFEFKQKLMKQGYNVFVHREPVFFAGAICNSAHNLPIVYYSKKKLVLEPYNIETKGEIKGIAGLLKPRFRKPTGKEVKEEAELLKRDVIPFTKAYKYSKKPVCEA